MRKLLGAGLVVLGIIAIIYGILEYQESKELLEIGSLEIEAGNKSPGSSVLMYWIGGFIAIMAGGIVWRRG